MISFGPINCSSESFFSLPLIIQIELFTDTFLILWLPTNNNSLDQIQTRNWQDISQAHISVGFDTNLLLIYTFQIVNSCICNIYYCAKATASPQILSWLLILLAEHNIKLELSATKISYRLIGITLFYKYWSKQVWGASHTFGVEKNKFNSSESILTAYCY